MNKKTESVLEKPVCAKCRFCRIDTDWHSEYYVTYSYSCCSSGRYKISVDPLTGKKNFKDISVGCAKKNDKFQCQDFSKVMCPKLYRFIKFFTEP